MSYSLIIEGQEYISPKEATRISRYTSDYVGQMARDGRVRSHKKGKGRYVHREDFLRYAFSQGKLKKGVYIPESFWFSKDRIDGKQDVGAEVAYVYEEDEGELIPKLLVKESPQELEVTPLESPDAIEGFVETPKVVEKRSSPLSFLTPVIALVLVVLSFFSFSALSPSSRPSQQAASLTADAQALVHEVLNVLGRVFLNVGRAVIKLGERTGSRGDFRDVPQAHFSSVHADPVTHPSSSGDLVVFPSTNFESDESKAEHIKRSFSDEVEVIPDETGASGYIVPAFSEDTEERYRYVIVPEG